MFVIGVTGGVGTGKSTVAGMFKRLGAVVLDADVIAHDVIQPKRPAWRATVKAFGRVVLNADGTINRRRLAANVFGSTSQRKRLERMIHPQVLRTIRQALRRLRQTPVVVLDVPLLLESGMKRDVDALVVVTAPRDVQHRRLARKFGWSKEEITARNAAQWTLAAKVALADFVVDNSGGVRATRTQVKRIWNQLRKHRKSS